MTTKLPMLEKIQGFLRDPEMLVEAANKCAEDYANGIEQPARYDHVLVAEGEDLPRVAQYLAGVYAVVSAIGAIVVVRRREEVTSQEIDAVAIGILQDIAKWKLGFVEMDLALRLFDLARNAGRPFRMDLGPLGRAERVDVYDFRRMTEESTMLPESRENFRNKFFLIAVARWLLKKLDGDE